MKILTDSLKILIVSLAGAVVVAAIDYLVDPFAGKPAVLALVVTVVFVVVINALPERYRWSPWWVDYAYILAGLSLIAGLAVAVMWGVS